MSKNSEPFLPKGRNVFYWAGALDGRVISKYFTNWGGSNLFDTQPEEGQKSKARKICILFINQSNVKMNKRTEYWPIRLQLLSLLLLLVSRNTDLLEMRENNQNKVFFLLFQFYFFIVIVNKLLFLPCFTRHG